MKDPGTGFKEKVELSPRKGVSNCWRCGAHAVGDFSWLLDGTAGDIKPPSAKQARPESMGPPQGFERLSAKDAHAPYLGYLRSRKMLYPAVEARVGVCRTGRYRGRVIVPHWDGDKWAGFAARAIDPKAEIKYLYPRGMPRRRLVWNLQHGVEEAWIVEGPFDGLALWPQAWATYGTGVNDEQVDLIVDAAPKRVVVCFDSDAWKTGRWLATRLRLRGLDVSWARLPPGQDPGTMGWTVREHVHALG